VTRSGSTLITAALIGSVQAGESFIFFVQTTDGGAFTPAGRGDHEYLQLPGRLSGGNGPVPLGCACGSDSRFGVAVKAVSGDELLTSVSTSAVPLPGALPLFATGLGAPGLLGWRRKRKG
jgi:hypothetical protein